MKSSEDRIANTDLLIRNSVIRCGFAAIRYSKE